MLQAAYDRVSAAYAAADSALLVEAYAPDAVVFPSAVGAEPLIGRESIRSGVGAMLDQAAASGARLSLGFEITRRRQLDGAVVDTGLYRLMERRETGECRIMVGKFLTVLAPQPDGDWAFVADTDTPMPEGRWTRDDLGGLECGSGRSSTND